MEQQNIGARLRQQRLSLGLSLNDITLRTRIPVHYLEAIEAGDFERLPGLIFTRNFVAQYCRTLDLAPDEMLAVFPRIEQIAMPLPEPPARPSVAATARALTQSSLFSSLVWLGVVVVGFGGAYVYFNPSPSTQASTVAPRSGQKLALGGAKTATAKTGKDQPTFSDGQGAPSNAAFDESSASDAEKKASGAENPAAAAAPVVVVISATQPAWISLTADGKPTFTGTLEPNETKEVSAEGQIRLVTGNAAGTSVLLNGKALDSLGAKGQVRIIRLTAAGPEFQSKAPDPDPDQDPL